MSSAVEALASWINGEVEKSEMELLVSACCKDEGVRSDGSISVEKAKLLEDNFKIFRPNGCIKWIEFIDPNRTLISIPTKDYGMWFNGGAMDPFVGVFPANLDDHVRYSSGAREYNRCLYLSLGLAMFMHPFLLLILFRFAMHHMVVNNPVWRYDESAAFWGPTWKNIAATVMDQSVQTDAASLVFVVDMFPDLFKNTTIAIVSVDSERLQASLSLINDYEVVVGPPHDGQNTVVLFLHNGHYTCHPGDREARRMFLANMKLNMVGHKWTPDGIDPIYTRVTTETLFQRWFNNAPPTRPLRPPPLAPPLRPLLPPLAPLLAPDVLDDTIFVTEFNMDPNWQGTLEESKALAMQTFKKHGLGCSVIRSRSSKCGDKGETTTINFTMGCSRAGKFKSKAVIGIIETSTKSTDCKSMISFNKVGKDGLFKVKSSNGNHNHEQCLSLGGFTQYTHPDEEQLAVIRREASAGKGPVMIHNVLLQQDPSTFVSIVQIKDYKRAIMLKTLRHRTPIQAFVDILRGLDCDGDGDAGDVNDDHDEYGVDDDDDDDDDDGSGQTFYSSASPKGDYYYALYIDKATGEIKRVAIFHKSSVELIRQYPWILLMDSTFNVVNIPGLRWLNYAGRTASGKYFIIGGGLMKGNDVTFRAFKWQMRAMKRLVYRDQSPDVIIGDRELAMVNAILAVFGALAVFILCLWHVDKAVEGAASKAFPDDDVKLEEFTACWKELRESKMEGLYEQRLQTLGDKYPSMIDYLKTEWLNHHRESIVDCFVNQHRHFGIRWSSPVEKQNYILKFYGNFTPGNHLKFLDVLTRLASAQHQRLTGELAKQSQRSPTAINHVALFANLQNLVSERALVLLRQQLDIYLESVEENGHALLPCTRYMHNCLGLQCAHDIARCFEVTLSPLSIDDVHPSWYLDPSREHFDKKTAMEPELQAPAASGGRGGGGRKSGAIHVGRGRIESEHETIDRQRRASNKLLVAKLQADHNRAEQEDKRVRAEQLRQAKEATKLAADKEKQRIKEAADKEKQRIKEAADQEKQRIKEAADQEKQRKKEAADQEKQRRSEEAATAKTLATAAKKKAREEESFLSTNKKKKCEHCLRFEVGWVYCDDGSSCSVNVSGVDDRWHKLCCAGLKSVPTTETWNCGLCSEI